MTKKIRTIIISIPTIAVFVLTLLLFTYIGFGEASRTYLNFQLSKLITQAEIIKRELEPHLKAGFPLVQFSGFAGLSEQLLVSDESIESVQVVSTKRKGIFLNFKYLLTEQEFAKETKSRQYTKVNIDKFRASKAIIENSGLSYRILLSLESKFGPEGYVIIEALKTDLLKKKDEKYSFVFYSFLVFSVCFIVINLIYNLFFASNQLRDRLVKSLYLICFILMSVIIGSTVFYIYEEGVQSQTKALSNSIAQRMNSILELGINISDIEGINNVITDYKSQNPDIQRITLTKDSKFRYHTDKLLIGKNYHTLDNTYEYVTPLSGGEVDKFILSLDIPVDVVTNVVLLNAKNFGVLFLACGLIALIFLKAGTSFITLFEQEGRIRGPDTLDIEEEEEEEAEEKEAADYNIGLNLIKPVYFLVVFVNALSISFLPHLVTEMVKSSGSDIASASLPFTVFYVFFAGILLPAGQYAEGGNLRKLMAFGFVFEVIGLSIIILTNDYWLFVIGRACSGLGQGLFLIGLQSYLLVIVPLERRTEAASVKVFGRNAALIAGASIGALLYSYIDYKTVFVIAFSLSIIGIFYLRLLIPEVKSTSSKRASSDKSLRTIFGNITSVFKDIDFVRTFFLVGLLGKMSITGVVMFAIPILLAKFDFPPEDIGQALMLYYISSMIMNHFVSRIVKKLGGTGIVLFMSTLIGGLGMMIFGLIGVGTASVGSSSMLGMQYLAVFGNYINGFIDQVSIENFRTYVILSCLLMTGISNGLLTAPIITRISNTKVALEKGYKGITATYTFLERGGHVLGPMVVSYLLVLTDYNQSAIAFFGGLTIVFGILFIILSMKSKKQKIALAKSHN